MKNEKLLERKSAVYQMGLLFNQSPSDDKITAYANALMGYTPPQIIFAFKQVISSGSAFFPSLAEILKHLRPDEEKKEDRAPTIANEILQAIRSFGQYDELRMIESLSEDARLTLLAIGGTSDLRNADQDNIGTTKAQLERAVKATLSSKEHSRKIEQLNRIGISIPGEILDFKKPEFRTMDYSGFLEQGPA